MTAPTAEPLRCHGRTFTNLPSRPVPLPAPPRACVRKLGERIRCNRIAGPIRGRSTDPAARARARARSRCASKAAHSVTRRRFDDAQIASFRRNVASFGRSSTHVHVYAERERTFCLTFLFRRGKTIDRVTFDRASSSVVRGCDVTRFAQTARTRPKSGRTRSCIIPFREAMREQAKRERGIFIFQFAPPRSFYSRIRSNKHFPEADSRGGILRVRVARC